MRCKTRRNSKRWARGNDRKKGSGSLVRKLLCPQVWKTQWMINKEHWRSRYWLRVLKYRDIPQTRQIVTRWKAGVWPADLQDKCYVCDGSAFNTVVIKHKCRSNYGQSRPPMLTVFNSWALTYSRIFTQKRQVVVNFGTTLKPVHF